MSYVRIAGALLGDAHVKPFKQFLAPPDIQPTSWYASVFARAHRDLAREMVLAAGPHGYVVELGSFIGMSATALVQAARRLNYSTTVVCVDTWLGDLKMWERKGRLLGPQGSSGEPRIWEQFMVNVISNNASSQIVPLRMPAATALRYLSRLIQAGSLPPPGAIYLDTAHAYPDTELELAEAWPVLPPGGLLVGDDYDRRWAPVQQSVNEFVALQPPGEFDDPQRFPHAWLRRTRRLVSLVDERGQSHATPLLLQLPGQWVLRKALARPTLGRPKARRIVKKALRCCLAGWADPQPANWSSSNGEGGEEFYYTRCNPPKAAFGQPSCHVGLRNHDSARQECTRIFACHSAVKYISTSE